MTILLREEMEGEYEEGASHLLLASHWCHSVILLLIGRDVTHRSEAGKYVPARNVIKKWQIIKVYTIHPSSVDIFCGNETPLIFFLGMH